MPAQLFTLEEANRLVRPLESLLAKAQGILDDLRHARDQLVDLRIIWGDKIESGDCPDHPEYQTFHDRFQASTVALDHLTAEAQALGCELKDLQNGLVDFQASRGTEVVYLCWRRGEPRIEWWHPLEGGFAARRPITEF